MGQGCPPCMAVQAILHTACAGGTLCTSQNTTSRVLFFLCSSVGSCNLSINLMRVVQVTLDIAHAIDQCLEVGVAHRDITLDNIGIVNGRGVLYDFSAAKVRIVLTYWFLEI